MGEAMTRNPRAGGSMSNGDAYASRESIHFGGALSCNFDLGLSARLCGGAAQYQLVSTDVDTHVPVHI